VLLWCEEMLLDEVGEYGPVLDALHGLIRFSND
jgi:hypothetical protein